MDIVENPQTKELFLSSGEVIDGCTRLYSFDGTPYAKSIGGWEVTGQAPHAQAWFDEPGRYGTFYGSMSVAMMDGNKWFKFTMGDNISYLRNWAIDAQEANVVSVNNCKAYSCRNVARSKSSY